MKHLDETIEIIDEIVKDRTVPRNIRETLKEIKDCFNSEEDIAIKKDKAIHMLDMITSDSNMPVYTRTQIWNLVSLLEEQS